MKVFKNFPKGHKCRICKKNTNKLYALIATQSPDQKKIKIYPFHIECMELSVDYTHIRGYGVLHATFKR